MASPETSHSARLTQGILLMIVAMLIIPAVDGIAKHLSADYSPVFIGWARYAVACVFVVPAAAFMRGPRIFPAERLGSHLMRTLFLVIAMTLYFLAIARIPLATAASVSFVSPIIAVVLSVVLLKEKFTGAKAVSLALGFSGSIVILRPGGAMDVGVLLALGAGISFAFYLIATRQASAASDPFKTLAFQCVVGTLLLTPQALLYWSAPAWDDLAFFAGLGFISAVTHILSITAFRLADASTLAPLVYVELIGAVVIGYAAFGEFPDAATIVGAALIVSAGLVLLRRGAR